MKKETLHRIAKLYDVNRETVEKNFYFIKDIQNIKKHGKAGKYNPNEWLDVIKKK